MHERALTLTALACQHLILSHKCQHSSAHQHDAGAHSHDCAHCHTLQLPTVMMTTMMLSWKTSRLSRTVMRGRTRTVMTHQTRTAMENVLVVAASASLHPARCVRASHAVPCCVILAMYLSFCPSILAALRVSSAC